MKEPKKPRRRRPKAVLTFTSTVPVIPRAEGEPFKAGYVRVSTSQQDAQRQVDELVRAGVDPRDVWGDVATGSTMDRYIRPGWNAMMMDLQPGDILVVHSIERISRDTLDLLTAMRDLNERNIKVQVLNFGMDATSPIGRLALTLFAAMGQFERDLALERTRSGIARAKERGVYLGSRKRFSDEACWEAYDLAGTLDAASRRLGCSMMTIKRAIARRPPKRALEATITVEESAEAAQEQTHD